MTTTEEKSAEPRLTAESASSSKASAPTPLNAFELALQTVGSELRQARQCARLLAHAWDHDTRPPEWALELGRGWDAHGNPKCQPPELDVLACRFHDDLASALRERVAEWSSFKSDTFRLCAQDISRLLDRFGLG